MKTNTLWMLLFVLLSSTVGFAQPPEHEPEETIRGEVSTYSRCFTGGFTTPPPTQFPLITSPSSIEAATTPPPFDVVISKDCPPDFDILYSLTNNGQCQSFTSGHGSTISNTLRIMIDDIHITNIPFGSSGSPQSMVGSVNLSEIWQMSQLSTMGVHVLKIVYCSTFTSATIGGGSISTFCNTPLSEIRMLVLGNGDQFFVKQVLETEVIPSCENIPTILQNMASCHELGGPDPQPKTLNYNFTDIRSESNKIQVYGGLKAEGGVSTPQGWHDLFSLSGGFSGGFSVSHDWTDIEATTLSVDYSLVVDPEEGECAWGSIQLNVNVVETTPVEVECTNLMPIGDFLCTHELVSFSFIECTGNMFPTGGCTQGCLPNINQILNGNNLTNSNGSKSFSNDCTFDLYATPCEDLDHMEFYTWTYPDGTMVDGPGISDVPPGVYTLLVFDICGDSYEMEIYVCGDESYSDWEYTENTGLLCAELICNESDCGPGYSTTECVPAEISDWHYNENSEQFCRTISCSPGTPCAEGFTSIEECVDATFGEWGYNELDEICEREVLFNGESSEFTDTSQPEYIYDYNDFFDECIRIIICGGSEVYEETEDPEYGDWNVENDFLDGVICLREVICFGDSDNNTGWEEEVNDNPEIEWEYDEFWNECQGQVFCDGFGGFNPDVEIEGEAIFSNWDIVFADITCTAEISCNYEGTFYETDLEFEVGYETEAIEIEEELGVYLCLVKRHCEVGEYFEESYVGTGLTMVNDITCRVTCQYDESVYIELPCDDLSPFIEDDGNMYFQSNEDLNVYNQIILSRLRDEPLFSPNPVSNVLTIKYLPTGLKSGRIEIIGSNGQVLQNQILDTGLTTVHVDMSKLENGLYFIRLLDSENVQIYQEKIIKSN